MFRVRTAVRMCLTLVVLGAIVLLTPARAEAQNLLGAKSQLVIDQISGFRVGHDGALHYYGPIGFSTRNVKEFGVLVNRNDSASRSYTTFWFAPSADFFPIEHLSVGGLIEFSTTSVSDTFVEGNVTTKIDRPSSNAFTILPRVGWLVNIGERFAIWPRGGLGYASRERLEPAGGRLFQKVSYSGFLIDVDVGFLFKIADGFFVKAAPQLSLSPGGSVTITNGPTTLSADASVFQFAIVTGVGGYINL
jgi:hypothetical protein